VIYLAIVLGMLFSFGLGVVLGYTYGWDRCWRDLTKDDKWRQDDW
jgi:hypothetical protein